MSKKDLQAKLEKAVENSDYEKIIELLRQGAEVTEDMVLYAEGRLSDLEQEYWDDKALYAGRTAKNSPQDYTYRIISHYAKGQKLDYIINSMFNRKVNPLKSKGDIITPKNKRELIKLIKAKKQYLGDIDISNIDDLSYLFEPIEKTGVQRTDLGGIEFWDTSHVKYMDGMFYNFDFTKVTKGSIKLLSEWISNLDTSNVVDMTGMFANSIGFNMDISNWDVSNVENMVCMFSYTVSFNQDLSNWKPNKVKDLLYFLSNAESFSYNLDSWEINHPVKNTYSVVSHTKPNIKNNIPKPKWAE